jgi:hypothetical protein
MKIPITKFHKVRCSGSSCHPVANGIAEYTIKDVQRELKEEEGGGEWKEFSADHDVSEGQFLVRGLELEQQQ